jgi:hypothetical protein
LPSLLYRQFSCQGYAEDQERVVQASKAFYCQ